MGKNVFEKESKVLAHAQSLADDTSQTVGIKDYKELLSNFDELLGEAKVITNISDRLQNKLNTTNDKLQAKTEEVQEANKNLEIKNIELQTTIDELTVAKADKKALAVLFALAILLFVLSEVVIDPFVERLVKNYGAFKDQDNMYMVAILLAKGAIALLLMPISDIVKKYMLKNALKNAKSMKPGLRLS
jgi:hypothetical protein